MRVAFATRLDARLAADTPVWIDEKMFLAGFQGNLPVIADVLVAWRIRADLRLW
jgi:hypothetical protein